ncbi:MAG TPA: DNA polymerase IV [Nitrospirae bacterium]|nr:DNA polymerase IV [Nitrospirota bacterium]
MEVRKIRYTEPVILCVDMDAFFASVEQQNNPRLRGKPIAVIGSGMRTVITTRSYEARKYGVKTGMNIYEAKKLCPHLIFVVGDNEKYTYTCSQLQKIYQKYSPDVEIYSIDEAFIDITTTSHLFGGVLQVGSLIKSDIKRQFGINCTVGIGPNILIAKLVSDLSKPNGLRWVKGEEIKSLLEDLPVKELWGIGNKISERLNKLGIHTCGDLARTPASFLRSHFGIIGENLKEMGLGICHRPIQKEEPLPKSIGHSMTLQRDITMDEEIQVYLLQLCEMVCRRARAYGFKGNTLSLTIRYSDFKSNTRQKSIHQPTNNTHEVYHHALSILKDMEIKSPIRLIGVSISKLTVDADNLSLFDDYSRQRSLYKAIDKINDTFGDFKITWGSYIKSSLGSKVISPAWRPEGVRNISVK